MAPYHKRKDDTVNHGIIEDDAVKHRLVEDDVLKWNPIDIWAENGGTRNESFPVKAQLS